MSLIEIPRSPLPAPPPSLARWMQIDPNPVGYLHSVETGAAADGPGLRFVYFLSGCPFHCLYCHNPDTWKLASGRSLTLDEAVAEIRPYAGFLRRAGGVTISGGDPLVQSEFVGRLLARLHDDLRLHTALDTQGFLGRKVSDEWLEPLDLVLLDVKHADPQAHRRITGQPLQPTLDFARRLVGLGKEIWIRYVLVPGLTDAPDDLERLAALLAPLSSSVSRVDVLPYHRIGVHKWTALGRTYRLADTAPPTPQAVADAVSILAAHGLPAC